MSPTPPSLPAPTVPEPWCPLPVRLHPAGQQVADWLTDWTYRRDLVRDQAAARRLGSRFALFAAYTCSGAEDLRLPAAWNAVNRLIADHLDEPGIDTARFARAALGRLPTGPLFVRPRPPSPLLAALDELWERTSSHRSAYWRERFVSHYRDWLAHSLLRHEITRSHARRRMHSCVEVGLDLTEAAADHELPRVLAHAQPYLELRWLATDIVRRYRDLYAAAPDGDGTGRQRALDGIARATRDFLAARDDLRGLTGYYPVTADEMDYALDTLALWVSGSLRWHQAADVSDVSDVTRPRPSVPS